LGAATLVDTDGDDSGWVVTPLESSYTTVSVVDVDPATSTLRIRIVKTHGTPEEGEELPPRHIKFDQARDDANTMRRIIIEGESIRNDTGVAWRQYEWFVMDSNRVSFDVAGSSGWTVGPFTRQTFLDLGATKVLRVDGGTVSDDANFTPSGGLVIETDLSGPSPVSFTLKQFPSDVPEPCTLALLGAGAWAFRRRLSRR
jgi:hypothetical protein